MFIIRHKISNRNVIGVYDGFVRRLLQQVSWCRYIDLHTYHGVCICIEPEGVNSCSQNVGGGLGWPHFLCAKMQGCSYTSVRDMPAPYSDETFRLNIRPVLWWCSW